MATKLEIHEIALTIPEMAEDEYQILKADIEENGLRDPIITYEGKILDGRNRERALRELGIPLDEYSVTPYDPEMDGDDPLAFVLSRNLKRRHLTPGQKAALGWEKLKGKSAELNAKKLLAKRGAPKKGEPNGNVSLGKEKITMAQLTEEVAAETGTTVESLEQFRLLEKESPEEAAAVKLGKKPLKTAKKEAKQKVDGADYEKALERIKKICGVEFFDALCAGDIKQLSAPDTVAYAQHGTAIMKRYKPLLATGWTLQRCLNVEQREVTSESRIQHLLDVAYLNENDVTITIEGWKIRVTRAAK